MDNRGYWCGYHFQKVDLHWYHFSLFPPSAWLNNINLHPNHDLPGSWYRLVTPDPSTGRWDPARTRHLLGRRRTRHPPVMTWGWHGRWSLVVAESSQFWSCRTCTSPSQSQRPDTTATCYYYFYYYLKMFCKHKSREHILMVRQLNDNDPVKKYTHQNCNYSWYCCTNHASSQHIRPRPKPKRTGITAKSRNWNQ